MRKCLLAALAIMVSSLCLAQLPTTQILQTKARTLRRFLDQNHYEPIKWNDSSSAMLYDRWLELLDDEKLFLTAADVARLDAYKTKLDDELLQGGDWKFFQQSVSAYQRGLQKADSIVKIYAAKPVAYTAAEEMPWPFKDYAATDAELASRWMRYLKWQSLRLMADALTERKETPAEKMPEDFSRLEEKTRADLLRREQKYISKKQNKSAAFNREMQERYLEAIAWCYDPHSTYMNFAHKKEFEAEMSASAYSAGLDVEENDKGELVISHLQPGGSAWRTGKLHKGDILVKTANGKIERTVEELTEEELDALLNGATQGEFQLTVRTANGDEKTVTLTREKISAEEDIVKSYVVSAGKNIGYINLPGFYSREDEGATEASNDGCANDVSKEIVKLKKDSLAGLILDLRFNGGGSMWEAMQLAGIFIDYGPVASVKEKDGKSSFLKDPNRGTSYDGPLLVLINGLSASASEFVSAMLQDYQRAVIVGSTTYGKGTAQLVLPLDTLTPMPGRRYDDYVKVTQEKFYRVNGGTTQWAGVVPDIFLPDFYGDAFKERAQKSALKPDTNKKGIYQPLPAPPIAALKSKSEARLASNAYFNMMNQFRTAYGSPGASRVVPLQWGRYMAHYNKISAFMKDLDLDEGHLVTSLKVRNNSFDAARINLSGEREKANNDLYLKHLMADPVLEEACFIMLNMTGN